VSNLVGVIVSELIGTASLVSVAKQVVLSRDTKDNPYISLCKEVGADILITGDKAFSIFLMER
jgi:predicted nucleic acid-binding protein